jgi:phosphinothricin acetyltransferase
VAPFGLLFGRLSDDIRRARAIICPMSAHAVRPARNEDRSVIAAIYNEGIREGRSTFETEQRTAADIAAWLDSQPHPVLVAQDAGEVVGWARVSPYSARPCYSGIGEPARGRGLGGALAAELRAEAARAGFHKLIGKLFAENRASLALATRYGFREVGLHLRHGEIGGRWHDVLVVELLLT